MSALTMPNATLAPAAPRTRELVYRVRDAFLNAEQLSIPTEHLLHAGMYARTLRLVPQSNAIQDQIVLASAHIKIPTVLIIRGQISILTNDGWTVFSGYNVVAGSAGRQSVFVTAGSPVEMTMLFPTTAQTVDQAEQEFTEEFELLISRRSNNDIVTITGERP